MATAECLGGRKCICLGAKEPGGRAGKLKATVSSG